MPFFFHYRKKSPTKCELCVILVLLKARHNLTDSCIDNLCRFLIQLGIKNVPTSFRQLKTFLSPQQNAIEFTEYRVCNECASLSQGKTQCRNPSCKLCGAYITFPIAFLHFPIESQLSSILSSTKIKYCDNNIRVSSAIELSDVCDGAVYRKFAQSQHDPFITLTFNVDGISIFQSSNRSVWIFTAAINEVTRQERFKLNHMLLLATCSDFCKPSKAQMQSILKPIVHQLKKLENEMVFNTPDQVMVWGRVSLILSCNDKPVQSLLQDLGEPHGHFGCGSFTIEGQSFHPGRKRKQLKSLCTKVLPTFIEENDEEF